MRDLSCHLIIESVKEMCIQATHFLSEDMCAAMNKAIKNEKSHCSSKFLFGKRRIIYMTVYSKSFSS